MTTDFRPAAASTRGNRSTLPITLLVQAAASAALLAPTVAAPRLLPHLGLTPVAVGFYVAIVYFGATLSSQWSAALIRRWGPMRTSQFALLLGSAGLVLVGLPSIAAGIAGALLIGAGYGPITPASSGILARTTAPHQYALVFSIKQTGVPAGGVVAGLLVPSLLNLAGHQAALGTIALICLAGAALGQWLRRDVDDLREPTSPMPMLRTMTGPIRFVLAHPVLRRLAMSSLVFSTVQVCLTAYLVSFLDDDLGWTLVAAGAAVSAAQVGGVVGRVLWGVVSDRRGDPRGTLLALGAAMAAASLTMSLLTPATPASWIFLLAAVYGATAVGWNGVFLGTVARVVPIHQASMATAGSLFFTYLGVVVGPPVFGLVGEIAGGLGPAYATLALPLAWAIWLLAGADWSRQPTGR